MSTIEIMHDHTLGKNQAKKLAEDVAETFGGRFHLRWHWKGDTIHFDALAGPAKGAKGDISVTGKNIHIWIDLPLVLRPFKRTVEAKVSEKLDQLL